jgi:hypothetical protein
MQDVPSSAGERIRARDKVVDYALDVTHQPLRAMPKISFQFDTLKIKKRQIPITRHLRHHVSAAKIDPG